MDTHLHLQPHAPYYTPLPEEPSLAGHPASPRRPLKGFALILGSVIFLLSLVVLIINQSQQPLPSPNNDNIPSLLSPSSPSKSKTASFSRQVPRGVEEGVSAKSNPSLFDQEVSYNWTNAMFSWQRTSYHFQPTKNWMNGRWKPESNYKFQLLYLFSSCGLLHHVFGLMAFCYWLLSFVGISLHCSSVGDSGFSASDPDGPLFHMGWYHLFYQYNPDSAVWGNITWGHAVSRDLIHWLYLPMAMVPDQWYDINGVWTGSATLLPDGQIVMLYTGDTDKSVQVQNLAYPANLSDPLLLDWVKYPGNPVLVPPTHIELDEFRDPTTGWIGPDGKWRITIGSRINETGVALVYHTTNFTTYELLDTLLHAVPGTGMWECVDFYPVAINGSVGLDTSAGGPGIKHVLKASLDDTKLDHYALGTYDPVSDKWTPDNPEEDVGIGLRLDYGRYYASKSFYDQYKKRRILWGWINETDTESDDLEKGWASVQTIPRTVLFDNKTGSNILQWPVQEIESLRYSSTDFEDVLIEPGLVVPLDIGTATQLDIFAEFETELLGSGGEEEGYSCSGGAINRSTMGPFGLLVTADKSLSELTPVFFRPTNTTNGTLDTYFCADETRSSLAPEVLKRVYGSKVPVLEGEKYSMRVLVDHSIVESFGQGGRTVVTSRIYPTEAIYGSARLFLFNNATGVNVKATLKIWQMNSAFIRPFPL